MEAPTNRSFGVYISAIVMAACLALVAALAVVRHRPPDMVPASAPPTEFSAERAFAHIREYARKPHPVGSAANGEVRDYLLQYIAGLGESPQVQEAMVNPHAGRASTIRNILVRVKGTQNTRAVALVAHYDSVPYGPGAADDGTGVATLLETLRALKAGSPLRNDVIFLFTDGEEGGQSKSGLRGAYGFARQHPWARDVGVLMNFDNRGTTGPAYMYETSPQNGWLIEQLAQAGCAPIANSAMGGISSRMPTASDFTMFTDVGIAGLNVAFIGGLTRYHTSLDNPDHLDRRSLQHEGTYALQLARRFGDLPLNTVTRQDAVFFNAFGTRLVHYSQGWVLPLTLFTLGLMIVVTAVGLARHRLTWNGMFRGFLGVLGWSVVACIVAGLVSFLGYGLHGVYILYNDTAILVAVLAIPAAVISRYVAARRSKQAVYDLAMGALVCFAILMTATAALSPGATFLFTWPLLSGLIGLALVFLLERDTERFTMVQSAVLLATAIPAVLILAPTISDMHMALTVVFAPVLALFAALLLGVLIPHLYIVTQLGRRCLPIGLAAVAIAFAIYGLLKPRFDAEHPKMSSLSYGLNADSGKAFWFSCDRAPDEWTSSLFSSGAQTDRLNEFLGPNETPYLKAPAPNASLAPPAVALVNDTTSDGVRQLRVRVTSPRQAERIVLFADPATKVQAASIDGVRLKEKEGPWILSYDSLPRKGIELTLDVPASTPVKLTAVDHSYELPQIPGNSVPPRPDFLIVRPNTLDFNHSLLKSNETLVAKTFAF